MARDELAHRASARDSFDSEMRISADAYRLALRLAGRLGTCRVEDQRAFASCQQHLQKRFGASGIVRDDPAALAREVVARRFVRRVLEVLFKPLVVLVELALIDLNA